MLNEIIPGLAAVKASQKLSEKIREQDVEIPDKIETFDIHYMEGNYKQAFTNMNKIETKAKVILGILTFVIVTALNLTRMVGDVLEHYTGGIRYFIFGLMGISFIYLLLAGVVVIQLLKKEEAVHLDPFYDDEKYDKKNIYIKTQLIVKQNLIRNQIMNAVVSSIRNAVICLAAIFVLTAFPFTQTINNDRPVEAIAMESICFSPRAMEWLIENKERDIAFDNIIATYIKEKKLEVPMHIYDKYSQLMITVVSKDDIYVIDDIVSEIKELN